jgi:hypothetical protein
MRSSLKLVEGRGTALAKDLAWKIIQNLTQKEDDDDHKDDDDEKSILHYLWIISNNKVSYN